MVGIETHINPELVSKGKTGSAYSAKGAMLIFHDEEDLRLFCEEALSLIAKRKKFDDRQDEPAEAEEVQS